MSQYGSGSKGCRKASATPIGKDLLRAQWRWPVGMPLCRPMVERPVGNPDGPVDETNGPRAAVPYRGHLVALHGFIKKTRTTPDDDLAMARKRQKELER